ncbi:MAG: antibiotic biosynthesis monooxygenase [Chloroflexi bacterium]|nr:antibiotic biosynthesis monooxygenase [Chloroflexota bacterium]
MFVAINRLSVPAEYAEHLEQAFGRRGSMAGVPGFVTFRLLRKQGGGEYLVETTWDDQAAFETWRESDAFQRAHSGTNSKSPVTSSLDTYEIVSEQNASPA